MPEGGAERRSMTSAVAAAETVARHGLAQGVGIGRGIWLLPLDTMFRTVGLRYGWLRGLFRNTPPPILRGLGQLRAERAAWRAIRGVPAYRPFLAERGVDPDELLPLGILRHLPETDKATYVDRFGLTERCIGGTFPYPGTTIDESSGSTGVPYNWIRARRERDVAQRNIGFFARYAFGPGPLITLNAFSMGAWAAGMNMSLGMVRHGVVKSIGPDVDKILSTVQQLGPSYRFLISGYPPFLKHLLDEGDRAGFPWADYELHGLVGGEGMTEELRDVLLGRFRSVYSGYGATDLEVGVAGESPVSVALRRLARARPEIAAALFGTESRLPMIFQYNPLIHWLETNSRREIVCTISRLDLLSPRIRYNVHDEGGVVDYETVRLVLRGFGIDLGRIGRLPEAAGPRGPLPWAEPIPLPFLWIHGRRDSTISVMGSNIYPEDVERVLYRDRAVAPRLHSFMLAVVDRDGDPRPAVDLELADLEGVDEAWRRRVGAALRDGLAELNADFRTSVAEFPGAMEPVVSTYAVGDGPFAGDRSRIKQRRIAT